MTLSRHRGWTYQNKGNSLWSQKKFPDFDVILSGQVFVVTTEIKTRSYAFYAAIKLMDENSELQVRQGNDHCQKEFFSEHWK